MQETLLTRKILKENFNFELIDMGDFWKAKKDNFVLLQPKCAIIEYELSFFYCMSENQINTFTDYTINTVEDLQRLCERENLNIKFTM